MILDTEESYQNNLLHPNNTVVQLQLFICLIQSKIKVGFLWMDYIKYVRNTATEHCFCLCNANPKSKELKHYY